MTNTSMGASQDLSSILAQVKGLEEEKMKLVQMLETERERLKETQAKADKMSESKRIEMQQALDTVIMNWLQDAVKDDKLRAEFKDGMDRLVKNTAEDSGVWQVMCCASNVHAQRLQELERMRVENEELKARSMAAGGDFRDESSRKRGREDIEGMGRQSHATDRDANIWTDFEDDINTGRMRINLNTFGTAV
jgi:hypothetical protein